MDTCEPYAAKIGNEELIYDFRKTADKLSHCRRHGPFGINSAGRLVVAWDEKCSCSKLCPDEARHEAQRLRDRYMPAVLEHVAAGGRVYKAVLTLPNYNGGRLREGKRYIFKKFRNRIMRRKDRFGILGALVIQEDPLGKHRDWNVHINVLFLTASWFPFKELRAEWGSQLDIRRYDDFDDHGQAKLFNELIKYATRALPEKSEDASHSVAPAMVEWTAPEFCEWWQANKGFRRTRAYGSLHGIGKPEHDAVMPEVWLGRLDYAQGRYKVHMRRTNLRELAAEQLDKGAAWGLDLIRGDKSPKANRYRGPP